MKMLPAGFPVALCNTAIQSCDRHGNRSFLLLRIPDFVVDAVDVVNVSVSEFVPSPPSEHLAFSGIVLMHRQILVAVEEVYGAPSAFKRRIQCLAFCNRSAHVAVLIMSFKSDAIVKHDFFFRQYCAPPMTFGILLVRTTLKVSSDGCHVFLVLLS